MTQLVIGVGECLRQQQRDLTGVNANDCFTLTKGTRPLLSIVKHVPMQLETKAVVEWIWPLSLPTKPCTRICNVSRFPFIEVALSRDSIGDQIFEILGLDWCCARGVRSCQRHKLDRLFSCSRRCISASTRFSLKEESVC